MFCPVTSQIKGYPFEVVLPAGMKVKGAVLCDQLKSLDWRVRRAKYAAKISAAVLAEVADRILALVDPHLAD